MPWALNFDGVNNEVVVSNFANTAPTSEVTVEYWATSRASPSNLRSSWPRITA